MLNAYRLGQLTAQPAKFQKMAAHSNIKRLVVARFTKEAMGETGEGGSQFFPEEAMNATPHAQSGPITDVSALEQQVKDLQGGGLVSGARKAEELAGKGVASAKKGLSWAGEKAKSFGGGIAGASESVGKALGGEVGKGFTKNPHTRTIAALLALLTAGGVGAHALSGGGDKKEV